MSHAPPHIGDACGDPDVRAARKIDHARSISTIARSRCRSASRPMCTKTPPGNSTRIVPLLFDSRTNCRNRTDHFRLRHDNRQQLRGELRTATKNPLAILIPPLEYLVRVHTVLACYPGNRCPRRERRFHNTTLLVHTAMDALLRFRLGHTLDDVVHSAIVCPRTTDVQTALRRRLPLN